MSSNYPPFSPPPGGPPGQPGYPQSPQAGYPQSPRAGYPQGPGYPQPYGAAQPGWPAGPQAGAPVPGGFGQPGFAPGGHGQWPQAGAPVPGGFGQPGFAPGGHGQWGQALGAAPAPAVSMNKWLYRIFVVGMAALGVLLTLWGATDSKVTELLAVSWVPLIVAEIVMLVFIYKMWNAISDGQARTSPGKAVGLLFVPLFNIYWLFQVWPGYATDYNRYLQRHGIQAPQLSQELIIAMITAVVFPLVSVILFWIVLGKICDAVNALPRRA